MSRNLNLPVSGLAADFHASHEFADHVACDRCNEAFGAEDLSVEAFEVHGDLYCPACVEALNEAAWDRQQEDAAAGDGPPTLAEQCASAWRQKQEAHRR